VPKIIEPDLFSHEYQICLDVRLSVGENLNLELGIARRGAGTHFKYPLSGLTEEQLHNFLTYRDYDISMGIDAQDAIYHLVWACYRKQDDEEGRKAAYEKIIANQKSRFIQLLGSRRYKEIIESEGNGVRISRCEPIQSGRNPQTQAEIEKEKEKFILAADNGLQSAFLAIRHDLGINPAVAFENTEDDRFAGCSASAFAAHPS